MKKTNTPKLVRSRPYFELIEVRDAKPLEGFKTHVVFTDGTEREIDLEKYLRGPVFEPIRNDPAMFRAMRIEGGTIAWSNEADIAPETLYYGDQDPPWIKVRSKRQMPKPRAKTKTLTPRELANEKHAKTSKRASAKKKPARTRAMSGAKPRRAR